MGLVLLVGETEVLEQKYQLSSSTLLIVIIGQSKTPAFPNFRKSDKKVQFENFL